MIIQSWTETQTDASGSRFSWAVSSIGVELPVHPSWVNIDSFLKIFIRNYLERVWSMAGTQLLKIDELQVVHSNDCWSRWRSPYLCSIACKQQMFGRAPSTPQQLHFLPFQSWVCLFSPIFCAQRACGTRWGGRWSCRWGRESSWRSKQTRRRTEFWWVRPCCRQPASSSGPRALSVFVSWFSPDTCRNRHLSLLYQEGFFDPNQCSVS